MKNNIIEEIRKIPIEEVAERMGYTIKKSGRRYYSLEEHDSVIINTEKNSYRRYSTGEYGDVINFYSNFSGTDVKTAIRELKDMYSIGNVYNIREVRKEKKEVKKEELDLNTEDLERDDNIKNIYRYLVGVRKLDKQIISKMIKEKKVYQSKKHKNCVFVSYYEGTEKPAFVMTKGTKGRFQREYGGNDYNHCYYIDNKARKLIVAESIIDGLSVLSLHKELGHKVEEYNILAICSASKYKAVKKQIERNDNIKEVIICYDNDRAGRESYEKTIEDIKGCKVNLHSFFPKEGKDWNEELKMIREDKSKIEKYINKREKEREIEERII